MTAENTVPAEEPEAVPEPVTPAVAPEAPEEPLALDTAELAALARTLSEAAGIVREAGRTLTAVATDPALLRSVSRSPRSGARAVGALARTLVD
ncbi:hypothetical protein AB0G46_30300, partial [Streptomyces sp. NPDC020667]